MQTQHKVQLDCRDANPGLVMTGNPYMAPVHQQMGIPAGYPQGGPPQGGPPQQAYGAYQAPPPQAGYGRGPTGYPPPAPAQGYPPPAQGYYPPPQGYPPPGAYK